MDIEKMEQLALVTLATREKEYMKQVTLELFKTVVSRPDINLDEIEIITETVRKLRDEFYELIANNDNAIREITGNVDHELVARWDFQKYYGIPDEDEDTNQVALFIDAWGVAGAAITTNTIANPTKPRTS